jgi:ABC-type dipeptide/oligopeptide/nickel transport system ATPase component
MIFQQPGMALNPFLRVGRQVAEVIRAHRPWNWSRCRDQAMLVFEQLFEEEPRRIWNAYPHELSGGQRQRVSIAQALACSPQLLIADEPTSSLDAVIQASVLEMFERLKRVSPLSFMFITHNPALLRGFADRVLVLEAGRLVEDGRLPDVYRRPRSAYSAGLTQPALTPLQNRKAL